MEMDKRDAPKALEQLREWFPKGSTVYTILRSVSRTGMSRVIGVVALLGRPDGSVSVMHPNYYTGLLVGCRMADHVDGIKINGAGMDMGFEIAYRLGTALYGDGYALKHKWM